MKQIPIKPILLASLLISCGYTSTSLAHSGGGTMDPTGTNAHFTAVADVSCFDDGNGPPHHLAVRIRDTSPPVAGLFISLHVLKGGRGISTTDTIPGDFHFSPEVTLAAGAGNYTLMATITDKGPRSFIADWHCETIDNIHTGTDDIIVRQFR